MKIDYSKYIIAFIVTLAIFLTTFYLSYFFSEKRLKNIKNIQDSIAIDIMSTETEFLLREISCRTEDGQVTSVSKLNELGNKLTYMEDKFGVSNEEVLSLKKYYSLLQIKDYILGKRIGDKCGKSKRPIYMMYFYTNRDNLCDDCPKQAAVLAELRELYPELRVYTFDYDLNLTALNSLKSIYKLKEEKFPILIIEDKSYYGFLNLEELKQKLPDNLKEAASSIATSTKSTTTKK